MEQSVSFSPNERQKEIRLLLEEHGHLTVSELATHFNVSEMTIRRDLKGLASQGIIQREHGGALYPPPSLQDEVFHHRLGEAEKEKTAIGYAAASLINPGETIILDAGTTTLAVAKAIEPKNLIVITNSVPASTLLTGQKGVSVLLTGGEVRESTYALVGPITRSNLSHFNANKLFLAATGVSLERGLSTTSLFESEVKQAMIQAANETILVAHSAKFEQVFYHTFTGWEHINTLVTDDKLPNSIAKELTERGIRLILAPTS